MIPNDQTSTLFLNGKHFIEALSKRLVDEGIPVQTVAVIEEMFHGEVFQIKVTIDSSLKQLKANLSLRRCDSAGEIAVRIEHLISELKNEYQTCIKSPDR